MNNDAKVALYLPRQNNKTCNNIKVLAGDIGGTKTNLGLFESADGKMKLLHENTYHSNKFPTFTAIIHQFLLESENEKPDRISIGVAGPVINKMVKTTNLPWEIDAAILQKETGAKEVALLNDLEANAYGLAGLENDDIITIYEAKNDAKGNIAIIAPGTGLGEAGLFWDGKNYHPFATEGGHCNFSQQSDLDIEIYNYLQKKYTIVSWEHLVSGPAIFTIYKFLRDVKKMEEPHWLEVRLNADDPSVVISNTALEGLSDICNETMKLFARYLARESYNLVLKLKSTGGLFLGGGIPPKILKYIQSDVFYETFRQSDRMDELISTVSIKLINNSKTALIGAAYYGCFGERK
jgi:glucokinase